MKPRVYIDTSVVGGYFDEEFAGITKKFLELPVTMTLTILRWLQ